MQEVGLGAVKDKMNWVRRDDHGQQRGAGLAAGDEVAGIDALVRNAPGDRRTHLGPGEIELGLLEHGLRGAHLRGSVALARFAGVELPHRHGLALDQRCGALNVERGKLQLGLGAVDVGLGLLDRDTIRPLIDDEEQIVLFDNLCPP